MSTEMQTQLREIDAMLAEEGAARRYFSCEALFAEGNNADQAPLFQELIDTHLDVFDDFESKMLLTSDVRAEVSPTPELENTEKVTLKTPGL